MSPWRWVSNGRKCGAIYIYLRQHSGHVSTKYFQLTLFKYFFIFNQEDFSLTSPRTVTFVDYNFPTSSPSCLLGLGPNYMQRVGSASIFTNSYINVLFLISTKQRNQTLSVLFLHTMLDMGLSHWSSAPPSSSSCMLVFILLLCCGFSVTLARGYLWSSTSKVHHDKLAIFDSYLFN